MLRALASAQRQRLAVRDSGGRLGLANGKWGAVTCSDGAAAAVHVPGASARGWVIYPEEVEVLVR